MFYHPFGYRAMMKINGKLVQMRNHKYHDQPSDIDKTGDLEFISKTTQVRAWFKLVAECPLKGDSCEGADYGSTLKVTHSNKTISLPIRGYSGC